MSDCKSESESFYSDDDYFVVLGQNNVEEDSQERTISTNNPTAVRDKEA